MEPQIGVLWRLIEKYNVKSFYTSPTALRAIKREDPDVKILKTYPMKTLTGIHMAGERCDPDTILWLKSGIESKILINDSWWQTESGWHISGNNLTYPFPVIPGSATKPLPGFNILILDENSNEILEKPDQMGKVVAKLPMPPSFMTTLWENDEAFIEKYISEDFQYYISGDAGFYDQNGYLNILTRLDDIIKTAGHRLSTGRMEEVINFHENVIESAVVAKNDDLKAEVPFAFVVAKTHIVGDEMLKKLVKEIGDKIVNDIGAISRLAGILIVNRLPKTRSGKILRKTMKKILNKEIYDLPPTIEDSSVLTEIEDLLKEKKFI